jgi:hypothetical protein
MVATRRSGRLLATSPGWTPPLIASASPVIGLIVVPASAAGATSTLTQPGQNRLWASTAWISLLRSAGALRELDVLEPPPTSGLLATLSSSSSSSTPSVSVSPCPSTLSAVSP